MSLSKQKISTNLADLNKKGHDGGGFMNFWVKIGYK
jgi:hypothetical protein